MGGGGGGGHICGIKTRPVKTRFKDCASRGGVTNDLHKTNDLMTASVVILTVNLLSFMFHNDLPLDNLVNGKTIRAGPGMRKFSALGLSG